MKVVPRRLTSLVVPTLLALAACGSERADFDVAAEESMAIGRASGGRGDAAGFQSIAPAPMAPPPAPPPAPQQDAPGAQSRLLIRTAHATIEVEALDPAVDAVRAIAERAGGYISNVGVSGGRNVTRSAHVTLRVPADRFDATLAALDSLGTVESKNVGSEDVGEQHADLEVRLANARRLEERLLELLANRTGTLEEVLAVERELARVRTDIERMDAMLRGLEDRIRLSAINISLHEPEPLFSTGQGENVILRSFRQAGRNFVGLVAGFIASLGVLVPLALLALILWWGWRQRRRRRIARNDTD